jgi:hypothetical protein
MARLPATEYSFRDRWQVEGTIDEVAGLLQQTAALTQWWPQLAKVSVEQTGDADGHSRLFKTRMHGFLPYVLDVQFRVVHVEFPRRFAVELTGDLCGRGSGVLAQDGPGVTIDFELTLRVERPVLIVFSLVARPALLAQHRWVMQQGERGLQSALSRRPALAA